MNYKLRKVSLDIEAEVHDIAVLDFVFLAFDSHLSGLAHSSLGAVADVVFVLDDLGADEATLEVCMDDACALRRNVQAFTSISPAVIKVCRESRW